MIVIVNAVACAINLLLAARYHMWWNGVAAGFSLAATYVAIEARHNRSKKWRK